LTFAHPRIALAATLVAFDSAQPQSVSADAARYAEAVSLIDAKKLDRAQAMLESIDRDDFVLDDYVKFDLAVIHHRQGDGEKAVAILSRLVGRYPDSPLVKKAYKLMVLAACADVASKSCGEALKKTASTKKIPKQFRPRWLFINARRSQADGGLVKAYKLYQKIYYAYPTSHEASLAGKAAALIKRENRDGMQSKFPDATYAQRKKRVSRLMSAFRYTEAAKDLEKTLSIGYSRKKKIETLYLLGKALNKSRKRESARKIYEKVIARYPGSPQAVNSSFAIAIIDWNQDHNTQCKTRLQKLAQRPYGAITRRRSLFVLGKIAESEKKFDKAKTYYRKALALKPDRKFAQTLGWRIAWSEYLRGRYTNAVNLLDTTLARRGAKSPFGDRYYYWKTRSLEKNGDTAELRKTREKLVDRFRNTYYGIVTASTILKSWVGSKGDINIIPLDSALGDPPKSIRIKKSARRSFDRAQLLIGAGLNEKAEMEIDSLRSKVRITANSAIWLGYLYSKSQAHYKSLRMQHSVNGGLASERDYSKPFWKLYYPVAYWDDVEKESRRRGVDPFLAMAIIRQESAFDTNALSPANARGLMQIIPSTGERMFLTAGIDKKPGEQFQPDTLFDPARNISMGVAYVADLLRRYGGNPALALAAYNAGANAVDRWLARFRSDPADEFVENIPYTETRNYVKRVIRNWVMYIRIYSGQNQAQDSGEVETGTGDVRGYKAYVQHDN